jgi:hypothetical protein
MKILFDQGTPVPLRRSLVGHSVSTAYELGWSNFKNGELIDAAEQQGFELLITTDQALRYQQNLAARKTAILVLMSTDWRRIQSRVEAIKRSIDSIAAGGYVELPI